MSVYIFTGPTLAPEVAAAELDAVYLPPVSQGDVYRVSLLRPEAIGIVDGYFERVPAVWHKEILWAMSQGIRVYGSASMGALRAAELSIFGMIGVGMVFEWYRDGVIERDDEVAIAHGPAESGYKAHSEALVNIRRTLADAEASGIIRSVTRLRLQQIAQEMFYRDRSYPLILEQARQESAIDRDEFQAFDKWLRRDGKGCRGINQKREDALAMLREMRLRLHERNPAERAQYDFEHTIWWEHLTRFAGTIELHNKPTPETVFLDALIEEMQIEGGTYIQAHESALLRCLAINYAECSDYYPDDSVLEETAVEFRKLRGLNESLDLARWLQTNQLDASGFHTLLRHEVMIGRTRALLEKHVVAHLLEHLKVTGEYERLIIRAQDKQRLLGNLGMQNPGLDGLGITGEELLRWYFQRQQLSVPERTDLYALEAEFSNDDSFRLALMREYLLFNTSADR